MSTDPGLTAMLTTARKASYAYALRLTHSHEEADDLAQEALEKLLAQDPVPDNPDAWITTATYFRFLDSLDARDARPLLGVDEDMADYAPDGRRAVEAFIRNGITVSDKVDRDAVERIWMALERALSAKEFELIQLTADRVPQSEIAEQLGYKNADTVKSTLVRIRRRIADDFQQFREEQGHPYAYQADHRPANRRGVSQQE